MRWTVYIWASLWCDFAVKTVRRYTRGKIRSSLKHVDSKSLGKVLTHVCNINNVTPSNELKEWLILMSSKDRTLLQVSIKTYAGAGEKAQRLQTLSIFQRTQGANKHLLFQFQGIWCFLLAFLVIRHVCLHMYDYTCSQDTHTYTLIILKHIIQYL